MKYPTTTPRMSSTVAIAKGTASQKCQTWFTCASITTSVRGTSLRTATAGRPGSDRIGLGLALAGPEGVEDLRTERVGRLLATAAGDDGAEHGFEVVGLEAGRAAPEVRLDARDRGHV